MATEIRRLVFSHAESTKALKVFGEKYDMTFPEGKIIRAKFAGNAEYEFHSMKQFKSSIHRDYNVEGKPSSVIVTYFDDKTFEHKFFNLTADFISGALIEYSIANKIMLPKAAKKALDVTEFNICLDINYDNETEESKHSSLVMEE
jgi:hypothetical protein